MNDQNLNDMNDEHKTAEPEAPTHAGATPQDIPVHPVFAEADIQANKFVAALSYVGILCLVPLLLKRESPYAQFHGKQGLVLAIIFFVGSVVFWIPLIGWAAFVFLFVIDVMALVRTLQGQAWQIPVVTDIVKKLNI